MHHTVTASSTIDVSAADTTSSPSVRSQIFVEPCSSSTTEVMTSIITSLAMPNASHITAQTMSASSATACLTLGSGRRYSSSRVEAMNGTSPTCCHGSGSSTDRQSPVNMNSVGVPESVTRSSVRATTSAPAALTSAMFISGVSAPLRAIQ